MEIAHILVLIFSFTILLVLGVPISFSIGIATIATMLMGIEGGPALTTVAQRMATGLDSFALLAIPFFILSGQLMNRGGIARRLIDFAKTLVGMFPGGLAFVNTMAAMLFGSISGSAVATASAIGGFMIPTMKKEGYDLNYSAAVNLTSATTGLIIPPSNILIVYSLASGGVSIGARFVAGYFPGVVIGVSDGCGRSDRTQEKIPGKRESQDQGWYSPVPQCCAEPLFDHTGHRWHRCRLLHGDGSFGHRCSVCIYSLSPHLQGGQMERSSENPSGLSDYDSHCDAAHRNIDGNVLAHIL